MSVLLETIFEDSGETVIESLSNESDHDPMSMDCADQPNTIIREDAYKIKAKKKGRRVLYLATIDGSQLANYPDELDNCMTAIETAYKKDTEPERMLPEPLSLRLGFVKGESRRSAIIRYDLNGKLTGRPEIFYRNVVIKKENTHQELGHYIKNKRIGRQVYSATATNMEAYIPDFTLPDIEKLSTKSVGSTAVVSFANLMNKTVAMYAWDNQLPWIYWSYLPSMPRVRLEGDREIPEPPLTPHYTIDPHSHAAIGGEYSHFKTPLRNLASTINHLLLRYYSAGGLAHGVRRDGLRELSHQINNHQREV